MSGDQRSVDMLGDRQLWRHAGWSNGAPLLTGCREEYHDLQGLIRPGGLAIRSCDPHITTRAKSAIVFSLMIDGSGSLGFRIFGTFRPVKRARMRKGILHQSKVASRCILVKVQAVPDFLKKGEHRSKRKVDPARSRCPAAAPSWTRSPRSRVNQ